MNIRGNEALRDRLAAEYVTGTLRGGARRRFEAWMYSDAALRTLVREWEGRLLPMHEFVRAQEPSPHIWRNIETRLHLKPERSRWHFWRGFGLGMASAAVAAALVATIGLQQVRGPSYDLVATLTDQQAQPALLVKADTRKRVLQVHTVGAAAVPEGRSLQLWAIPKAGSPRSLGVLGADGRGTFALAAGGVGGDVVLLAISLEPLGGSPDPNGPTGPVLYKGPWLKAM
ncbi:anti-sigma factor domain-containing protein [Pseudoduganella sp.]|uniref:anti-sigma factor n=1 Tax=Pseudoduganella sp. TaxID=1880898 RepID=UPI0035B328E1